MLTRWHFCLHELEMTIDACYKIGYIMKPHGLKGAVTIGLDPEAPEDLAALDTIFVEVGERLLPYFIEDISVRGRKAFLKLEEVDTPEAAQAISKSPIYLPKTSRPDATEDTFYDDEVIGFDVEDVHFGPLGKIAEIVSAGPNKLLSVDRDGGEVLIPLNSPFISAIDKQRKHLTVSLPEGYLDI